MHGSPAPLICIYANAKGHVLECSFVYLCVQNVVPSHISFVFLNETNFSSKAILVSIFEVFTYVEFRFEPYF